MPNNTKTHAPQDGDLQADLAVQEDRHQPYVVLSRLQYEGNLYVPAAEGQEPTIAKMLPEHAEEMERRGIVAPYVGEVAQPAA